MLLRIPFFLKQKGFSMFFLLVMWGYFTSVTHIKRERELLQQYFLCFSFYICTLLKFLKQIGNCKVGTSLKKYLLLFVLF